ncbi:hypothetical protein MMC28_008600 [Mycoblastus sanguinarius]|nr:hypothetical protein [Mycoblastus sanguinarius]
MNFELEKSYAENEEQNKKIHTCLTEITTLRKKVDVAEQRIKAGNSYISKCKREWQSYKTRMSQLAEIAQAQRVQLLKESDDEIYELDSQLEKRVRSISIPDQLYIKLLGQRTDLVLFAAKLAQERDRTRGTYKLVQQDRDSKQKDLGVVQKAVTDLVVRVEVYKQQCNGTLPQSYFAHQEQYNTLEQSFLILQQDREQLTESLNYLQQPANRL